MWTNVRGNNLFGNERPGWYFDMCTNVRPCKNRVWTNIRVNECPGFDYLLCNWNHLIVINYGSDIVVGTQS